MRQGSKWFKSYCRHLIGPHMRSWSLPLILSLKILIISMNLPNSDLLQLPQLEHAGHREILRFGQLNI